MTSTEKTRALEPEHFDGDEEAVSEIQGELYDIERARKHLGIESRLIDWPEKKGD
jgi:hypothetical protein